MPYTKFRMAEYIKKQTTEHARILFRTRAGVVDLKSYKGYMYQDLECRLCGDEEEDLGHILYKCTCLPEGRIIKNIYETNKEDDQYIAKRVKMFKDKVDEKETESEEEKNVKKDF